MKKVPLRPFKNFHGKFWNRIGFYTALPRTVMRLAGLFGSLTVGKVLPQEIVADFSKKQKSGFEFSEKGGITVLKKHIPNLLTAGRTAFALVISVLPFGTPAFWVCYFAGGICDVLDGFLARLWHVETKFGDRFDSLADIAFLIAAACKILPEIVLPFGIWIWIAAIGITKMLRFAFCSFRAGKLQTCHRFWNRAAGILLFLLPCSIGSPLFLPAACLACAAASLSAVVR